MRLLRIDPARAVPLVEVPTDGQLVLAELRGPSREPRLDDFALHTVKMPLGSRWIVGVPPQGADILMRAPQLTPDSVAHAAIGVDPAGLLLYAETADNKPGVLPQALSAAGV